MHVGKQKTYVQTSMYNIENYLIKLNFITLKCTKNQNKFVDFMPILKVLVLGQYQKDINFL